jgi:N-methylhydantoinase B
VAYPLRVEEYGLIADSEGPGTQRGGLGMRRAIRVLGKEVRLTLSSDRSEVAPWGLFGGQAARPSRCVVVAPDGSERRLPSKVTTVVEGGHMIVTETPGGGGWGEPQTRDPQAVCRDVMEELVSVARARAVYYVAINEKTMDVDADATRSLRA